MKKLLLVDADPLALCVLDVGLRKAGYFVTTAVDVADALAKVDANGPDVVVTGTRPPELDGVALVRAMKGRPELADVPILLLASADAVADRDAALALGVEDCLAKPVYLCELTARIQLLLARRARQSIESHEAAPSSRSQLSGSTHDLALADLLRSVAASRKSGVALVRNGMHEARIFFRGGTIVDAELGPLRGEEAIFRALTWSEAAFDVEFKPVPNEDAIGSSTGAVLMKGMRRVDEWVRLCAQVQPLATLLDVPAPQLLERLSTLTEIPEALKAMVRLPGRPATLSASAEGTAEGTAAKLDGAAAEATARAEVHSVEETAKWPPVSEATAEAVASGVSTLRPEANADEETAEWPPANQTTAEAARPEETAPWPPVSAIAEAELAAAAEEAASGAFAVEPPVATVIPAATPTPAPTATPTTAPAPTSTPTELASVPATPASSPGPHSAPTLVSSAPPAPHAAEEDDSPAPPSLADLADSASSDAHEETTKPAAPGAVRRAAAKTGDWPTLSRRGSPSERPQQGPTETPLAPAAASAKVPDPKTDAKTPDPTPDAKTASPKAASPKAASAAKTLAATPAAKVAATAPAAKAAPAEPAPAPPAKSPSLRPSSAPWTREVTEAEDSVLADAFAAGVPRAMAAKTKRVGAGVAVIVLGLFAFIGLRSVRERQQREAEEARARNVAVTSATPAARGEARPAPVPAAVEAPSAAVAAAVTATATATVAASAEPAEVAPAATNAAGAAGAAAAGPAAGAANAPAATPLAPVNTKESAIDVRYAMHSTSPLVRDAQRALLKGDTAHAIELAQKAVVKDASDADGWLTLAAARKASGDFTGASEAYQSCIAQARTEGVMHCRVLAAGHSTVEVPVEHTQKQTAPAHEIERSPAGF